MRNMKSAIRRLALAATALTAVSANAGIKYWDNPDYRAFDVDCYVPGAVWNLDGIDNAGVGVHDSTATTWKNLGSSGSDNDMFIRITNQAGNGWGNTSALASLGTVNERDTGSWVDNGFVFAGDSELRYNNPGRIDTGTSYTIQMLVDGTIDGQAYPYTYLMSIQKDHFAFMVDKSTGRLYWKTQNSTTSNHPFMTDGSLGYMTAILDGTAKTAAFFSGTVPPTTGDGFRQFSSVSGKSDTGGCICGYTAYDGFFTGTMHSYRYYTNVLSQTELAWNRVVDERRFFNRVAPLPVTNAVVVSSIAASAEPAGTYAVDGRHIFTAPRVATVGNAKYICTGYTLEEWDDATDDWGAPVFHARELSCKVEDADCVRITWKWMDGEGIKTYDVSDYVWDGLVLFYDGICNVGTNEAHSVTATTWKNLGSAGAVNDMFLQRLNANANGWIVASDFSVVDGRDPGAWTADGFALKGDSRFRVVNTDGQNGYINTGTDYSLQMLLDAKAADQKQNFSYPFSLSADKYSFIFYQSGNLAWRNDNDGWNTGNNNPITISGSSFGYVTAIANGTNNTTAFFSGTTIPTSGSGFRQYESITAHGLERGYDLGGYGNNNYDRLLIGTIKNFRQYDHALTAAEVAQNRKVDNWRYFGIPDVTNVVVQSTVPYLYGDEPDGAYSVDGAHTFTAPATVTAKGIDYACDGYTVETWDGSAWSNATSYESCSYAYNISAGLVRLTWRWRPTHGLRTAADYSYSDYSQAGLYWHYDGLLNQGAGKARSTDANATWVNLGSAGATYDMTKYLVGSKVDGEWTDDGYLFRGGTRFRVVGKPIGPFKSFSIQVLVDADMNRQPAGKSCYVMSGMWDYFAMALGNKGDAYNGAFYGNFQGLGTDTGNKHASVYFKNDSGHYDFATGIMDYDAKTAQVFGGVEPPASGTGFHQFDSVTSRNDSGFGLGNGGGDGTDAFVGTMKSFRYYDRVLTEEELVRNRNVDAVRYFGALGVTNVVEVIGDKETACKVEGSWTFEVPDEKVDGKDIAGYYTEELDSNGKWTDKQWHEVTEQFVYNEETAAGKTIRLTWCGPRPGMMLFVR